MKWNKSGGGKRKCILLYSQICFADKAKVIYAAPEVYLPYGQPAVLDCHFRSNPPLKNLRWEKDGLLFDSYNVPVSCYHHKTVITCTVYTKSRQQKKTRKLSP